MIDEDTALSSRYEVGRITNYIAGHRANYSNIWSH